MPNGLKNWTSGAVVKFLRSQGFTHDHTKGSHFFYSKGKNRLVCVPIHGKNGIIAVGTMKGIVIQSGIPESEWRNK